MGRTKRQPRNRDEDFEEQPGILGQLPTVADLERRLAELDIEAARVRTLLQAVREMQGSRQELEYDPVEQAFRPTG